MLPHVITISYYDLLCMSLYIYISIHTYTYACIECLYLYVQPCRSILCVFICSTLLYIARLCLIIKGYMSSGVYPTVAILAYFDWVHEWRKQNVWFRYMFLLLGKSMWLLLYMFMFSPNLWIGKACKTSQTQHGYNYYMRPRLYIMILIQYHMTSPQNGMIWVTICIMVINPVINPPFEDYFLHSYGKWSPSANSMDRHRMAPEPQARRGWYLLQTFMFPDWH